MNFFNGIANIILCLIVCVFILSWTFIFINGTVEIMYWMFTGEFYHFFGQSGNSIF